MHPRNPHAWCYSTTRPHPEMQTRTQLQVWELSFKIKINDFGYDCDYMTPGNGCLAVMISYHSNNAQEALTSLIMYNDTIVNYNVPDQQVQYDWNEFKYDVLIPPAHFNMTYTDIFVTRIPSQYSYQIDDMKMVKKT